MQMCADKAGGVTGRRGTPGLCWGTELEMRCDCDVHDSTASGTGDGLCISGGARNPSEVTSSCLWPCVCSSSKERLPELDLVP